MRTQSNFDFYCHISIFPYHHFFFEIILQINILITIFEGYSCLSVVILHLFHTRFMSENLYTTSLFMFFVHVYVAKVIEITWVSSSNKHDFF